MELQYDDSPEEPPTKSEEVIKSIIVNAEVTAAKEREVGVLEAFRRFPKATLWSLFLGITIIMAGYDGQVVPSLFGVAAFVNRYADGEISAAWQSGLGMGNPIGQVVGTLCIPWPSERWGRKKTLYACTLALTGCNFIQFFSPSLAVLCAGEVLAGFVWGAFIALAPTYISEISPLALRGILEAYMNMSFVIGQFVATGMIDGFNSRPDEWAYRAPFALQWLWCLILLIGIPFIPESPWYLVRGNRRDEAKRSLERFGWEDIEEAVSVIEQTDLLEREFKTSSSYFDCFKGVNLARTEICAMLYSIPVFSGLPMIAYCIYFFERAGMSQDVAVNMSLGNNAIGLFAGFCSFVMITIAGRRTIYNYTISVLVIMLFVIGALDCAPNYDTNKSFSWAQASLLDIWTFIYQMATGPLTFVYISEVSASKLRSRTIAVATACQALINIGMTVAVPYMFNPEDANMRGKIGFFFGGLGCFSVTWAYFRLPETKGRTFEELDIMFERRIKARDFKNYVIHEFS